MLLSEVELFPNRKELKELDIKLKHIGGMMYQIRLKTKDGMDFIGNAIVPATEKEKELLERDTPMKIIGPATAKCLCPACLKTYVTFSNRFCHWCGQRLEWSEE